MSQPVLGLSGRHLKYPTEEQLRRFMLDGAREFQTRTGMLPTEIGFRALGDPAFLGRIAEGRDFYLKTFEVFMSWLDSSWPSGTDKRIPRIPRRPRRRERVVVPNAGGRRSATEVKRGAS